MKSYKIKSLVLFLLFVAAALFYNTIELEQNLQNEFTSNEVVDIDTEQLEDTDSEEIGAPIQ